MGNRGNITTKRYAIESELGVISTKSHRAAREKETIYDSSKELFEEVSSREKFKSIRFKELALDYSTDMSVRDASRRLNRIRHESTTKGVRAGISAQTYRNTVEREGMEIEAAMEKKCIESLCSNGFNSDGEMLESNEFNELDSKFTPEESKYMQIEAIGTAAAELNLKNKVYVADYESPENAVNISVDDVGVDRQTEVRPRGEEEQPKRVNNSVVHVESDDRKYILKSSNVFGVLRLLLGFLLRGGLLKKQLVFFTDGAREIHNAISRMFAFANYKIILDWYHLQKKCKEQLSMGLKGSKIRNEFLDELLPCLWFGNIDGSISLLQNIDSKKVKSPEFIAKLAEYFERVREFIPCYALRKELGLRNSSNLGEKSNDLIVSSRQKHNGMSWSDDGSHAFASVAAALCNNELEQWLHANSLSFKLSKPVAV